MRVIPRAEWGAKPARSRMLRLLRMPTAGHWNGNMIVVNGQTTWDHSVCASLVRGIQNFHMVNRGWADIAYNFIECPHGFTFEGRGFNVVNAANGTNVGNQNHHAIMCLAGDGNEFPDAEKVGFRECVKHVADNTEAPDEAIGHRDLRATACPGDVRYAWIRSGMPIGSPTPIPTPVPTPTPTPQPDLSEKNRIKFLQSLTGATIDGLWGPNTEAAINRNLIGWNKNLPGNKNRNLVKFLQAQGNRKFNNNMAEDGLLGPATNHLIVIQLGQRDGIAGPNAWRSAVK